MAQLRLPANTKAVRFVPHKAVLPEASLVITHAGWQTVNAVSHVVYRLSASLMVVINRITPFEFSPSVPVFVSARRHQLARCGESSSRRSETRA